MSIASIRAEIGGVLRRLRGEYSVQHVADALGITRQAVAKLEVGELSLSRLDALADFYGVDFHLTATDRVTGQVFAAGAVLEVAPKPGQRVERVASTRLLQVIGTPAPPVRAPLPPREPGTGRFQQPVTEDAQVAPVNRCGDAPVETAGQRRRRAG